MANKTIEILLSHDIELDSEIGLYRGSNRDGSGKELYRGWYPTWEPQEDKCGFGFGNFGEDSFLGEGSEVLTEVPTDDKDKGFGYGYFGYGEFGYWSIFKNFYLSNLENGLHVFDARIKDAAGNISDSIIDDIIVWICERPDALNNISLDSYSGQSITISWS